MRPNWTPKSTFRDSRQSHSCSKFTRDHDDLDINNQNLRADFFERRKESQLNNMFNLRKQRLQSITRSNRMIYEKINMQESHYKKFREGQDRSRTPKSGYELSETKISLQKLNTFIRNQLQKSSALQTITNSNINTAARSVSKFFSQNKTIQYNACNTLDPNDIGSLRVMSGNLQQRTGKFKIRKQSKKSYQYNVPQIYQMF